MTNSFAHIGHKIIAVVGLIVTLSLLALGMFYVQQQEESILAQNERTMTKLTESVIQGLQSVMLAGYADIARGFADRLEQVPDVTDFRILRTSGEQAFLDNDTIEDVNARRGEEEFLPRDDEETVQVLPSTHTELTKALQTRETVPFYETSSDGERFLTFLAPILNDEGCHKCHGKEKPVRGVLKLTTSLAAVQEDIQATWVQSSLVVGAAILGTLLLTGLLIRRAVVRPIDRVTRAMVRAADGDLTQTVPVMGRDELSQMAFSFNHMTRQLMQTYTGLRNEQDKLATIILSAREGIVVTDGEGKVVLMNPAAEALVGKSIRQVAAEGFLNLIDDPEGLRNLLERDPQIKEPETVHFGNRVLSVYAATIRTPQGGVVGSAALLRDITEEKRLEDRLRRLSTTDGLTGLFNRRHLDETLTVEVERARRYGAPLSIMMFDVDHFKRFNDEHGHDQGDRVLQAIAQAFQEHVRKVDVPCRYGGEEFLGILPGTTQAGAIIVAERLRRAVEHMEVDGLKVTISIGVASLADLDAENATELVEAADDALYRAKRAGRNQVITARRGGSEPG
ncbi:MAG: diguanylate cyclase [Gammaproteobacteria bacterium]|nr:diguanylate cyclase [Gammaproteobacteria bacterium]